MIYSIETKVILTMEHHKGELTSEVKSTKLNLDISKNLDRKMYLDKGDLPTEVGSKAISANLIAGLISNIKHAHAKGWRDESEHIRWVIGHLQQGFVTDAKVGDSTFGNLDNQTGENGG